MQVLIIGGTGLISTGIVKHLLARKAGVTMFNRGQRDAVIPAGVQVRHGDRNDLAVFERECGQDRWDAVIDMICYSPEQATADVKIFGGRCDQFIFSNATRQQHMTWREYYRTVGTVLGKPVQVLFMPADWITAHDPQRFGLLREITAFHGAYNSGKARRDVPEFHCEVDFATGAAHTLADARRRGALRSSVSDTLYQSMVDKALAMGFAPVTP